MHHFIAVIVAIACFASSAAADTLSFKGGGSIECSVIQESPERVTVIFGSGLLTFERSQVFEIKKATPAKDADTYRSRIPSWKRAVTELAGKAWAKDLKPIAATVIDEGVFKHVPYKSHAFAADGEMNVYGDPADPVAFEIGLYAPTQTDADAKKRCVEYVAELLATEADKAALRKLDLAKGLVVIDQMTVEITPPEASDAFGGWWVSVYFEEKVNGVRATSVDLAAITVAKSAAAKERAIAAARREVRAADAAKAKKTVASSDESASDDMQVLGTGSAESRREQYRASNASGKTQASRTSGGGRVYVSGYTRKDGTYVRGHTRAAPKRRK